MEDMESYFDPFKQSNIVYRDSNKIHDTQTLKYFDFAEKSKFELLKNPYGITEDNPISFQAFSVRLKPIHQPRSLDKVHKEVFKALDKGIPTEKVNKKPKKYSQAHS